MRHRTIIKTALVLLVGTSLGTSSEGRAQDTNEDESVHSGRAIAYRQLDAASLEHLTPPDRIRRVAEGGFAPTEIWRALEHGEKVECLDCIPSVSKLIYDGNARTREISAWWLRRRIFGVFGPGQIYSQVVDTLNDPSQPETRRAHAAEALGEFLVRAGTPHVARAAVSDESPLVRHSAVRALQRMNHPGPNGELAAALSDVDEEVRLAAVLATTRVNAFDEVDQIALRLDDSSSAVRVVAIEALGALRAEDAVLAMIAKLDPDNEPAASARAAAAAALGEIGDASAREALRKALESDEDRFVRDAAQIALRRL